MGYEEDPANLLTVRYSPDTDGTGQLFVKAASHGFAGESSAWFDTATLIGFAEQLSTYPIPDGEGFSIQSGFGSLHDADLAQEHVKLEVRSVGLRGQVGVFVHLATPLWGNAHGRDPELVGDVRLQIPTTYERLRTFSGHFTRVLLGTMPDATLGAEVLL